jgi:hypothetical protein
MSVSETWCAALSVIADHSPMTFWRMSNGAVFWWILTSRAHLLDEQFAEQPFRYTEIVSGCVFSEVRMGKEVVSCDWPVLRESLLNIPGLRAEKMKDVRMPPFLPQTKHYVSQ